MLLVKHILVVLLVCIRVIPIEFIMHYILASVSRLRPLQCNACLADVSCAETAGL